MPEYPAPTQAALDALQALTGAQRKRVEQLMVDVGSVLSRFKSITTSEAIKRSIADNPRAIGAAVIQHLKN